MTEVEEIVNRIMDRLEEEVEDEIGESTEFDELSATARSELRRVLDQWITDTFGGAEYVKIALAVLAKAGDASLSELLNIGFDKWIVDMSDQQKTLLTALKELIEGKRELFGRRELNEMPRLSLEGKAVYYTKFCVVRQILYGECQAVMPVTGGEGPQVPLHLTDVENVKPATALLDLFADDKQTEDDIRDFFHLYTWSLASEYWDLLLNPDAFKNANIVSFDDVKNKHATADLLVVNLNLALR